MTAQETGRTGKTGRERRRGLPIGALVLIAIGTLLLLQTTGVAPWGIWLDLWRFWPVIVIAAGVNMLLGRRVPWLAVALVALLFAAAIGGALALSWNDGETVLTSLAEPLGGLESVDARITFGAGDLVVASLEPDSVNLVEGRFETPGRGAQVDLDRRAASADLRIKMEDRRWLRWFSGSGADWKVFLSQSAKLTLDLDAGAANITLDLRDLQVNELEVDVGAADLKITMPANAGRVDASLNVGASSVDIIVPDGVAARITQSSGISSFEIDSQRFPEVDGEHVSPGFDDADNQLVLDVRAGASSVSVR